MNVYEKGDLTDAGVGCTISLAVIVAVLALNLAMFYALAMIVKAVFFA